MVEDRSDKLHRLYFDLGIVEWPLGELLFLSLSASLEWFVPAFSVGIVEPDQDARKLALGLAGKVEVFDAASYFEDLSIFACDIDVLEKFPWSSGVGPVTNCSAELGVATALDKFCPDLCPD